MKNRKALHWASVVCCSSILGVGAASAADEGAAPQAPASGDAKSIEQLQKQIDELRHAIDTLKSAQQDAARTSISYGRATWATADGRSTLSLRALVQGDAAHYNQDAAGALASDYRRGSTGATGNRETNGARDLSDGAYFRRARFGVEGVIARDFNYRLVLELGGSGTEGPTRINDAWINYVGFAPFTIQVGAYSPPANMDDGTSPEDSLFIERASSAELSRALGGADGRLGAGVRASGTRWMSALTLTSRTVGDAEVFDSQSALVGRVAGLVAGGNDYNIHLGLSGTYVLHAADQGLDSAGARYGIRFRERPELRVDSTRLIDTGSIDADHAYAAGAEFAANWKSWYLQGENFWYGIERRAAPALSDPRFSGFYVQGSWILTGESRRYNMANGAYQNPRPFLPFSRGNGWGAWELALRFSHTDLDFHEGAAGQAAAADAVRGGVQDIWTFGINWYVNTNLRFLLNYLNVDVDRLNPAGPGNLTPFGTGAATPPLGAQIGQHFSIYALRTQFSF